LSPRREQEWPRFEGGGELQSLLVVKEELLSSLTCTCEPNCLLKLSFDMAANGKTGERG
ncbi:hypothetical protein ABG768_011745, partial [Culter alburnus]